MVILAPMAGVTDLAFRLIVKKFGCDLVVSEMISAQGLIYDNARTKLLLNSCESEKPLAIQLFGHDPEILADAASLVVDNYKPDMIDLNMGCPTPKIVKNGDGAALLKNPELVSKIVSAVVKSVSIPVTVKIRLGWDNDSINCEEIAQRVEDAGAHWISIHARTRDQFYGGSANWEKIRRIKSLIKIPVVGNGDVRSPQLAKKLQNETGCDHIMVGRGILGKPWLLRDIKHYLDTGILLEEPDVAKRFEIALEHLELKIILQGEIQAVREMRSHLAWYLKGLPHSGKIRAKMNQIKSYNEVKDLLSELLKDLAPARDI